MPLVVNWVSASGKGTGAWLQSPSRQRRLHLNRRRQGAALTAPNSWLPLPSKHRVLGFRVCDEVEQLVVHGNGVLWHPLKHVCTHEGRGTTDGAVLMSARKKLSTVKTGLNPLATYTLVQPAPPARSSLRQLSALAETQAHLTTTCAW